MNVLCIKLGRLMMLYDSWMCYVLNWEDWWCIKLSLIRIHFKHIVASLCRNSNVYHFYQQQRCHESNVKLANKCYKSIAFTSITRREISIVFSWKLRTRNWSYNFNSVTKSWQNMIYIGIIRSLFNSVKVTSLKDKLIIW